MRFLILPLAAVLIAAAALGHSNNTAAVSDGGLGVHGNNPGQSNTQPIFFQWIGVNIAGTLVAFTPDEYAILSALTDIDSFAGRMLNNAGQCGELAVMLCGEGGICCFCYSGNGNQSCSFSCQDAAGDCEACPECGPDMVSY